MRSYQPAAASIAASKAVTAAAGAAAGEQTSSATVTIRTIEGHAHTYRNFCTGSTGNSRNPLEKPADECRPQNTAVAFAEAAAAAQALSGGLAAGCTASGAALGCVLASFRLSRLRAVVTDQIRLTWKN